MASEGLTLRPAVPADLPMLEIWARAAAAGDGPPFIAVTFSTFEKEPGRGSLLIVEDAGTEAGYVVLSRLWSNRLRGEVAIIDDMHAEGIDQHLIEFEVRRFASEHGLSVVLGRDETGHLVESA
ncbi:MAG: hypothetical protein CMM50_18460 [Rhodospirillaceae bacterium]|nr:hypothetical protein [Rhodospirillaceae bacterium]|tara:strand:+ start:105 stop:476 length:372 start_codon:yes stop_codon:yes gene_type:complete